MPLPIEWAMLRGVELCTIVLEQDVRVDARKYGRILAPMLGITPLEAKMLVRKGRGILLEDIDEAQARVLVEELARDGVRARSVRNEDLPILPAPHKAGAVERAAAGLRLRGAADEAWIELGWAQIDIVSIGVVALPDFRELFAGAAFEAPALYKLDAEPGVRELIRENIILKMGQRPREDRSRSSEAAGDSVFDEIQSRYARKVKVYGDLLDSARQAWLRVSMDEIGYAHDAGSVRLGECWGFHLFAEQLRAHCAAALTEMSLNLVPGVDIKDVAFLQVEEFNRYTAWHAVLHSLGMKPCPAADTFLPSPEPPGPSTDAGFSSASPEPEPPSTSS